ncbi:hypothetical protein MJG53_019436 [Ovis ammon polii x Ovis aries]|uniref:Uncharacterized protein n=1 Tax=Ovis ammon polii x Ovis aries TaxID=2918886 RepID=A0ACB9TZB6_9CETA|nr:hypothetical protein MJG53_019436 [Ovis ammon polii x Ovis aries]
MGVLQAKPCLGLIQDMVQLLQSGGIKTVVNLVSADLGEELKTSTAILSIGIGSLDKLLDAYLYTGEVTGITGGPGSSKTQARTLDQEEQAGALQRIQVVPAFDIFQMLKVL